MFERHVTILGAGVAGLTAAHELVDRGFLVHVYEARDVYGGKARSFETVPTSVRLTRLNKKLRELAKEHELGEEPQKRAPEEEQKTYQAKKKAYDEAAESLKKAYEGEPGGEPLMPAEHGFRLFPAFYKHLPHTMARIPLEGGKVWPTQSVADRLVPGKRVLIARKGKQRDFDVPLRLTSADDIRFALDTGIPPYEAPFAVAKLLTLLAASEARWNGEFESTTWWDFIGAAGMSDAYQKFLGAVGVRWFAAMDPKRASTRTIGKIGLQLWKDFLFGVVTGDPSRPKLDQFLDGPTNDVWIDPWVKYLEAKRNVTFTRNRKVVRIDCRNHEVKEVTFEDGGSVEIKGYCISTLPIDAIVDVLRRSPELKNSDPAMRKLENLLQCNGWMVGVQFYLLNDIPIAPGGLILADAPWALTAVSQTQFWQDEFKRLSAIEVNGVKKPVKGVLSVIISDWNAPGDFCGKCAKGCTPEELADEVWAELKAHINQAGRNYPRDEDVISDGDLIAWNCSIPYQDNRWTNPEQLLLNETGSWDNRPEAVTSLPNFFFAGDYVRTNTDLATMEGANEAARRAVNGILEQSRSSAKPCDIWPLELELPAPLQALRKTAAAADILQIQASRIAAVANFAKRQFFGGKP